MNKEELRMAQRKDILNGLKEFTETLENEVKFEKVLDSQIEALANNIANLETTILAIVGYQTIYPDGRYF